MIENVDTKKRYVGSSTNIQQRLKLHERLIRQGYGINRLMGEDIKAGHTEFFAVILATFKDGAITNRDLARIERQYTKALGAEGEYNYPGSSARTRFGSKNPVLYAHGTLEMLGMHKPRQNLINVHENDHAPENHQ